jgi:carbon monoxide dehydrogenase subunit G
MKFSTKEDVEAPISHVFDAVSDFEMFERAALRRGGQVLRTDRFTVPQAGMGWQVQFTYRGKARRIAVRLEELEHPTRLRFLGGSAALDGEVIVGLVSLGPRRTRLSVELEMKPRTIAARLFLQTLRLAKARLTRRYKLRVNDFARAIESRARRVVLA